MTIKQIEEMILEVQARASGIYLDRQRLQMQNQQLQAMMMQSDASLLKTDAEIETLNKIKQMLVEEAKEAAKPEGKELKKDKTNG